MLQTYRMDHSATQGSQPPEVRSPIESLAEGLAFIRRRFWTIFLTCLVTLVIALLYLVTAVPIFTSSAQLVIDSKAPPGDAASVSTIVESQIAIIKSESVARTVIQKLGLAEDPEFSRQSVIRGMIKSTLQLLGWRRPEPESSATGNAVESFKRRLSAKRVGITYIVEITFDSVDPERAAQILNAVSETYVMAQMDAKYGSALQGEKWIKERASELSNQAEAAKKAVADYHKRRTTVAGSAGAGDAGAPASPLMTRTQGELRELEAAAEAAARTYDNFLRVQRYLEAQQQAFNIGPVSESHVLASASRPLGASSPKVGIVLAISTAGGVFLGVLIGMLRDLSARGIRASGQEPGLSLHGDELDRLGPDAARPDHQSEASAKARRLHLTSSA